MIILRYCAGVITWIALFALFTCEMLLGIFFFNRSKTANEALNFTDINSK